MLRSLRHGIKRLDDKLQQYILPAYTNLHKPTRSHTTSYPEGSLCKILGVEGQIIYGTVEAERR